MRCWPLVVADFRREYGITTSGLARMTEDEFTWLLQGLSENARFNAEFRDAPQGIYTPEDRAAVHSY